MLSSSLDTLLKVSKTISPPKLFAYDCVTLYVPLSPDPAVVNVRLYARTLLRGVFWINIFLN